NDLYAKTQLLPYTALFRSPLDGRRLVRFDALDLPQRVRQRASAAGAGAPAGRSARLGSTADGDARFAAGGGRAAGSDRAGAPRRGTARLFGAILDRWLRADGLAAPLRCGEHAAEHAEDTVHR